MTRVVEEAGLYFKHRSGMAENMRRRIVNAKGSFSLCYVYLLVLELYAFYRVVEDISIIANRC